MTDVTLRMRQNYTEAEFLADFPDERACANRIMSAQGSKGGLWCVDCARSTPHFYIEKHRLCVCGRCGNEHDFLNGTIFDHSGVSLRKWFRAIFWIWKRVYISDEELASKLTIKTSTAARMQRKIRRQLGGQYFYAYLS